MKLLLFGILILLGKELHAREEVSLSLEALYLRANTAGLEYARIDEAYLTPNPSFSFGSRIGVNYSSGQQGWDIGALWTYYGAKAKGGARNCQNISSMCSSGQEKIEAIESLWNIGLNCFDCTLGNAFIEFERLRLLPSIGIRLADVGQSFVIDHRFERLFFKVKQKNHFKGFGLIGGIDPSWKFRNGFDLFGRFASALIYGNFWLSKKERGNKASISFRDVRLCADTVLGISHGAFSENERYRMKTTLSCNYLLFVDQKRFWKINRSARQLHRGDLSLKGVSFSVLYEY